MKWFSRYTLVALFALGMSGFALTGCEEDSALEDAAEGVDDAVDDTGDAIDDTVDDIGDELDG